MTWAAITRRRFASALTVCLLVSTPRSALAQASMGAPPAADLGARDLSADFRLPPLKAGDRSLRAVVEATQVARRALALGLTSASAVEAWRAAAERLNRARGLVERPWPGATVVFSGTLASQLNATLRSAPEGASVRVAGRTLRLDEPIRLSGSGVALDLGEAVLSAAASMRYMLRIENATGARVRGGVFAGGPWGVLVQGGRGVVLQGLVLEGTEGGVALTSTAAPVVWGLRLTGVRAGAPLLMHTGTVGAVLAHNEIASGQGASNWHAGIVISDRNAAVETEPDAILNPDRFGVIEQPIPTRLRPPRDAVIAFNRIAQNKSSGVYSDGGVRNVVFGNLIEGNAKEGLCLDNGSTSSVVAFNLVLRNGKRWGKTDAELRQDFVERFGRLPDGSSAAKVPGLSLDNALYNIVYGNEVDQNYGGGVKMVRTAFFNLIGLNTLVDNNIGASEKFHFFGMEFGSAKADTPVPDLDFTPSRGNVVFSNLIRGQHYAGLFFADGSDLNDVFDNVIMSSGPWALESVRRMPNSSLNNLTNLPSRNIGSNISPELLRAAKETGD